jgi:hypothetical protein
VETGFFAQLAGRSGWRGYFTRLNAGLWPGSRVNSKPAAGRALQRRHRSSKDAPEIPPAISQVTMRLCLLVQAARLPTQSKTFSFPAWCCQNIALVRSLAELLLGMAHGDHKSGSWMLTVPVNGEANGKQASPRWSPPSPAPVNNRMLI